MNVKLIKTRVCKQNTNHGQAARRPKSRLALTILRHHCLYAGKRLIFRIDMSEQNKRLNSVSKTKMNK